jgi:hypothetical protein
MWVSIVAIDTSGREFELRAHFEFGQDMTLQFTLPVAIPTDDATLDQLDEAIFNAAPTRWMH